MKEKLKQVYYRILMVLPTRVVAYIENFRAYKKFPNLKNPKYFGEKIQWLKLNGHLERYGNYVDKYVVRDHTKEKIGEKYLIPLIGVYDDPNEIDYNKLPEKFVLKCNHGSGYNIICTDKSKLDIKKTNKQLKKWLEEDFSKIKGEVQYKNVKRKILCEKYVVDKEGHLKDYRFFCFNGKPEFVLVDNELHGSNPKRDFFDMNWNKIDMRNSEPNSTEEVAKPLGFEEMKKVAGELSKDFPFVRVDLYDVDGKIYFGELTFTHAGGRKAFSPLEKDLWVASMINLESYD